MVELQSCATLVKAVNASALSAIEQEVKGDSVSINIVAEISAELQRERHKNVELMERISILEAQIQEKKKETLVADEQGNYQHSAARGIKKFKRQKIEIGTYQGESGNTVQTQMALQHKPDNEAKAPEEMDTVNRVVNWMSMEDSQVLCVEKLKDSDSVADFDDTDRDEEFDDNYDDDDDDMENGQRNGELDENTKASNLFKDNLPDCLNEQLHKQSLENFSGRRNDPTTNMRQAVQENQKKNCILSSALLNRSGVKMDGEEVIEHIGGCRAPLDVPSSGCRSISQHRKPLKVAFCPKEVKGIIESNALLEKNAQSHTIRKILVFASLGIRHGCEDMYELDFNHFSIFKKGEPYVSPRNPGEHVLYENAGVRRKVFYPNRQNPILCPVQILEEEKAMRPLDASCPSCLFLCIKYGGRTRNLPQNEYVRQRMGRNKLKSFGPLMCRMAMLVHIRSGSFFFKALGITLLFMAGFPDDLVQRETKYQNLDLLQKYYRTDEDAKGEELFLPHPITCDQQASTEPQNITRKPPPAKSRGRKHTNSISKSQNFKKNLKQSTPSTSSTAPTQFGLTGYSPAHTSMPSEISKDTSRLSNLALRPSSTTANHNSYHMLTPQLTSAFVPLMYWPAPPNVFAPPGPYPSTFGYQSFPSSASYMSFHTQPYYTHPSCSSSLPKLLEGSGKNDAASEESDSDSDSTSGSDDQKKRSAI